MLPKEVEYGDLVRVIKGSEVIEGIVLPSTEFSSEDIIVLKLPSGYNIGVSTRGARFEVLRKGAVRISPEVPMGRTAISGNGDLRISLISTGGTIVSKVEYETGAVKPAITAEELVDMVPELLKHIKELEVVELYRLFSEDITPRHWEKISAAVADKVMEGYDGVVIAHGTDTMSFTASALAFALRNLPVPVILVGAQRSSDRPSSDTILNLRACAITVRNAPFGEVVVAMHGSTSDR
ncbi:MAG: Glu-tRNA(Gln) amidotransferase GatDE subunit D, partial [Thermoprotei archaeon]